MEGAARAGKGACEIIGDGEVNMSEKVISSLSKAALPALTNLKHSWSAPGAVLLDSSHSLATTFHNEPLVFSAVLKEGTPSLPLPTLMIACVETQSRKKLEFVVNLAEAQELPQQGEELFKMAARMKLREKELDPSEGERLSKKYQVLSAFTSMVAVEKLRNTLHGPLQQEKLIPILTGPGSAHQPPQLPSASWVNNPGYIDFSSAGAGGMRWGSAGPSHPPPIPGGMAPPPPPSFLGGLTAMPAASGLFGAPQPQPQAFSAIPQSSSWDFSAPPPPGAAAPPPPL